MLAGVLDDGWYSSPRDDPSQSWDGILELGYLDRILLIENSLSC